MNRVRLTVNSFRGPTAALRWASFAAALVLIIATVLLALGLSIALPPEFVRAAAEPNCKDLAGISLGPNKLVYQLIIEYSPKRGRPETTPQNTDTFVDLCHKFDLPRKPIDVVVAGSTDGLAETNVDDRIELSIQGPDGARTFRYDYPPGRDPKEVRPVRPLRLTKEYFSLSGAYTVRVQAIDVYGYSYSASDVYLVVELEPEPTTTDGGGGAAGLAAVVLVLVIGGSVVLILISGASRGSGPEIEEGT
ncbi:MAG: hypothetical protein HYY02_10695 [Chloroflexi bacterium]|nr:hypothetical protein [Chloroflexota bacterium]